MKINSTTARTAVVYLSCSKNQVRYISVVKVSITRNYGVSKSVMTSINIKDNPVTIDGCIEGMITENRLCNEENPSVDAIVTELLTLFKLERTNI